MLIDIGVEVDVVEIIGVGGGTGAQVEQHVGHTRRQDADQRHLVDSGQRRDGVPRTSRQLHGRDTAMWRGRRAGSGATRRVAIGVTVGVVVIIVIAAVIVIRRCTGSMSGKRSGHIGIVVVRHVGRVCLGGGGGATGGGGARRCQGDARRHVAEPDVVEPGDGDGGVDVDVDVDVNMDPRAHVGGPQPHAADVDRVRIVGHRGGDGVRNGILNENGDMPIGRVEGDETMDMQKSFPPGVTGSLSVSAGATVWGRC